MTWLKRLGAVLAVLAAAALVVRWSVGRYATRRVTTARSSLEELVGPLELARLAPAEVPEDDNTARWVLAAAAAIDGEAYAETREQLSDLLCCDLGEWTEPERQAARRILERQAEAVALLPRIAAASRSDFGLRYGDGWEELVHGMPEWMQVVRLTRLASLAARTALDDPSAARYLAATGALASMAEALCSEPLLLTMILGVDIERGALRSVGDFLAAGAPWPEVVGALTELVVPGACPGQPGRGMRGEAVLTGSAFAEGTLGEGSSGRSWWAAPARPLAEAVFLEEHLHVLGGLDQPYTEYLRRYEEGSRRPAALLAPNIVDAVGKAKAAETSRILAAAALDLARRRVDAGRFPESQALGPTPYTGEVPVYTRGDGWAEVAAPASEAFYRSHQAPPNECQPAPPLFRFRLEVPMPAPAP
jgi:hypothetical protein